MNKKTCKIVEYTCDEIPSNIRDEIIDMEHKLTIIMCKHARKCNVGWNMTLPTEKNLFGNLDMKYVVYFIGNKIAGYLSYMYNSSDNNDYDKSSITFKNVYVDEKYRRKGIASKMVRYVMYKYPKSYYTFSIIGQNESSLALFKSVGCCNKPLMSIYMFHNDYSWDE